MGSEYDFEVSNDPEFILAQGQAGQANQAILIGAAITGAIQSINGLLGPNLTFTGSNVTVSPGGSVITLSIAQAISTGSSPQFTGLTITGTAGIATLTLTNALGVAYGGTGATSASGARTNLGIDAIATKKSNLAAAVAPGVTDDAAAGYAVGSIWCDTTADDAYICLDSTNGAAVWKKMTP